MVKKSARGVLASLRGSTLRRNFRRLEALAPKEEADGAAGAFLGFGNVAVHGHVPGWLKRSDIEFVAVSDTDETPSRAARLLPHATGANQPGVAG
jgi:hypothetical protein